MTRMTALVAPLQPRVLLRTYSYMVVKHALHGLFEKAHLFGYVLSILLALLALTHFLPSWIHVHDTIRDERIELGAVAFVIFYRFFIWAPYSVYNDREGDARQQVADARQKEKLLSDERARLEQELKRAERELSSKRPKFFISIEGLYALSAVTEATPIYAFALSPQIPSRKTGATLGEPRDSCVIAVKLKLLNSGPVSCISKIELAIIAEGAETVTSNELMNPTKFRVRHYKSFVMSRGSHPPEPGETIVTRGHVPTHDSELEGDLSRFLESDHPPQLETNQIERGWLVFKAETTIDVVNRALLRLVIIDPLGVSSSEEIRLDPSHGFSAELVIADTSSQQNTPRAQRTL